MAQTKQQAGSHETLDVAPPQVTGAHPVGEDSSPVDRQLEAQAIMQAAFDKAVSKELGTPFRYVSVSVLIIHWAEYLDRDLKCGKEVRTCLV